MNARVGVDDTAHLADLEGVGGTLEGLLHLAGAEEAEVSTLLS